MFWINSHCFFIVIFKEIQAYNSESTTPHQIVSLGECNGISCSSLGFTGDQYRMFCLFTKPERWKWASSVISKLFRMSGFSHSKRLIARSNAPLRLTIWNGILSFTVPLPTNHDKLSRWLNIQIWNVSVGSVPPCTKNFTHNTSNQVGSSMLCQYQYFEVGVKWSGFFCQGT